MNLAPDVSDAADDWRADQARVLRRVLERSGLAIEPVWLRYFALGGSAGVAEAEAHVRGRTVLPAVEGDILAHAVNELLDEQSVRERVPYLRAPREPLPEKGALAALVSALGGMHLAPPERLSAVAVSAGAALDVEIAVFLVDYEQTDLHPLGGPGGAHGEMLGVDTSLAGMAFRNLEVLSKQGDDTATLWVPLLDGVERLGVLQVSLHDPAQAHDAGLRRDLVWLSRLLGHLVTATTDYGDALDRVRRTGPRNTAAELIWQLLPPRTAGTEKVSLSGMIEPSYAVGGDAFDYALSETTAHLAIFDATGHSVESGVVTAVAVSAYRTVRRDGGTLFEQAMAVDEVIRDEFRRTGRMITSVLAELDLDSGRLRYISAGHPYPLVLRGGKVVKSLTAGRRPIFGLEARKMTVGEEMLEPGDWLVLYTDGITEARDENGQFFGVERLEDFLARETAAGHPPPEMVRRLTRSVLAHQHGKLQDDATALVVRWGAFAWDVRP